LWTKIRGAPRDINEWYTAAFAGCSTIVKTQETRHIMEGLETLFRLSDRQHRKYRRFELAFPVRMKFQSGAGSAEIEAVSKNISLGGLLVRSTLPIPPHTSVTFILSVHGKHSVRPVRLMGEGEVVRVEGGEAEATFMMAVKCNAPVTQLEEYLPA